MSRLGVGENKIGLVQISSAVSLRLLSPQPTLCRVRIISEQRGNTMQHQLIPVTQFTVGSESIPTVNARDLHAFLEVKQDFSDWIKKQIDRARLVENRDFTTLPFKRERQILVDYHLTIDAGKSIGMMSATDKGFEIRDYFIECENISKNPALLFNDPAAMRGLLLSYTEKVISLETKVSILQPESDALHKIALSDGLLCLTDAAKTIGVQPQKVFIPLLRENKWIYKRTGSNSNRCSWNIR
jgi:anti-repressor protein